MGRNATHEDDEDEKRERHRFKRVPTRNGEAGALMYLDLASRFSLWGKTAEKLKGYVSEYLHMVKIHRNNT